MNQPAKVSEARSKKTSLSDLLDNADHLVTEFERLLASELHLLKTGQADGLEAIAEAKQLLVNKVDAQENELIELFEEQSKNKRIVSLKERLAQCRVDNQNNHALVMLELKHTNGSLELLRSVLRMDDLELYSDSGEVRINREKRKLGSA